MRAVEHQITIRELHADDLDRLFDAGNRHAAERWLERQARGEVFVAVAERNGVPVGRVVLDFAHTGAESVPQLQAAHVDSQYRSRGIGTALFTHLEQVAAQRGAAAVELLVGKANHRARALYTRLGYVTCGEDVARWTYREGDSFIQDSEDCWVMRKPLGRPTSIGYNTVTLAG